MRDQELHKQLTDIAVGLAKVNERLSAIEEDVHDIKDDMVPRREYEANKQATCQKIKSVRNQGWWTWTAISIFLVAFVGAKFLGIPI